MDWLSRIVAWLSDHEAAISAVAAIIVIGGVVLAGLRLLVRRRGDTTRAMAPGAPSEPAPAIETSTPGLDPLTVPGFEGRPAIAVLPFDNLSGDPDQEYFADGIAEDLITRLSAWRDFPVIARNSSFTYKGKAVDVKQVSRELGVRYLVEGSVRKAEGRVRISAQLIDATTGGHIWAETYDRELQDIFALQDEISDAVVHAIQPELLRTEKERVLRRNAEDLDAWETLLRASWHYRRFTREDNVKARALYQRAIELDPNDASGFAGLALTHHLDLQYHWSTDPAESAALLQQMARRAVALDPHDIRAHYALAFAHGQAGRRDEMLRVLERAIEVGPGSASAHGGLGYALTLAGRPEEGIVSLERAMRLDPKSPDLSMWLTSMAWAHFLAGRYEVAVGCALRGSRENPNYPFPYRVLAASYGHLDRPEDARQVLEDGLRLEPDLSLSKISSEPWAASLAPELHEHFIDGLRKAGLPEGTEA